MANTIRSWAQVRQWAVDRLGMTWPNDWWPYGNSRFDDCAAFVSAGLLGLNGTAPYFTYVSQLQRFYGARGDMGSMIPGDVAAFDFGSGDYQHTEFVDSGVDAGGYFRTIGTNAGPGDNVAFRTRHVSQVLTFARPDYVTNAPAGLPGNPELEGEDEMTLLAAIQRAGAGRLFHDGGPKNEWGINDERVVRAAILQLTGELFVLPSELEPRKQGIALEQGAGDGLFVAVKENSDGMSTTSFLRFLDANGFTGEDHPWGTFVENTFEINGGSTRQVRVGPKGADLTVEYPTRQDVWRDLRPVRVTKGGKTVTGYVTKGGRPFVLVEGSTTPVELIVNATVNQQDRANAQKAGGQKWVAI